MVPKTIFDSTQLVSTQSHSDDSRSRLDRALTTIAENDPELGRLIGAWRDVPDALRAGILAMIDAAKKS